MPAPKSAQDILVTELKEIYSAERQFSRAVPKLSRKITSEALKRKLEERRDQGARLIEELDGVLDELHVTKSRPKNVAAEGLIEDMNEHIEEIQQPELLDAVLLGAVQKLEHYCIAAWGTSKSLGALLGQQPVVELMERLLEEGRRYDQELTELAESEINPAMLAEGDDDEDEDEDEEEEEEEEETQAPKRARK